MATTGCTSAGIDCATVKHVVFHGFPPSIIEFVQALGHTGCHETSSMETDAFYIICSITEFINLLIHIYRGNDDNDNPIALTNNVSASLSVEALQLRQWSALYTVFVRIYVTCQLLSYADGSCW